MAPAQVHLGDATGRRESGLKFVGLKVLLGVCLILAHPAEALAQNYRYGIHTYYLSSYLAQKSRDLGTGYVRIQIDWDTLQPRSRRDWNDGLLRAWLSTANSHSLKLYATLANTPRWAGSCQHCMPDQIADWYEFVYRVISQTRRDYPDLEIVFGIWNEPNLTGPNGFFQGTDADYALLFQSASLAREAADPAVRLAAPEISVGGFGPLVFLESVLTKIGPHFRERDIVTFHWYPGQGALSDWVSAVAGAAAGHEVWLTETGDNTCNDTEQRGWIDYVINTFDYKSPSPLWTKIFVYYLWDAYTNCAANLVRMDGSNRPAFVAYRNRTTGATTRQRAISLRASNAKFVTAEGGGNDKVFANQRALGAWEIFDLIDLNGGALLDGDKIALQSASGLYLQADQGGPGPLLATGAAPEGWETFTIVAVGRPRGILRSGDSIALQSDRGYFVSADLIGPEDLTADRKSIGSWETFELIEY
jgi:hypothetical protein